MQSDQSLCQALEYFMSVKLLAEHHLEFLSIKGGCTGSYESTLVKMPHCWKSHGAAHTVMSSEANISNPKVLYYFTRTWVKVKNFQNPELELLILKLAVYPQNINHFRF